MDASINLGNLLREKGWTISTAESCTGGFIAHLITLSPGASDYFPGSVVSKNASHLTRTMGAPGLGQTPVYCVLPN